MEPSIDQLEERKLNVNSCRKLGCGVAAFLMVFSVVAEPGQLGILTPPVAKAPRINGPRVYGVRPGRPILYRVPVTGADAEVKVEGAIEAEGRNSRSEANGLREGWTFNPATRILSGMITKRGEYRL